MSSNQYQPPLPMSGQFPHSSQQQRTELMLPQNQLQSDHQVQVTTQPYVTNPHVSPGDITFLRDASTIKLYKDPRLYLLAILFFVAFMMGLAYSQISQVVFYKVYCDSAFCGTGHAITFSVTFLCFTCGLCAFHVIDIIHIVAIYPLRSQPHFSQIKSTTLQTINYFVGASIVAVILIMWGVSQGELGEQYAILGHSHRKAAIALDVLAGIGMIAYIICCFWAVKTTSNS